MAAIQIYLFLLYSLLFQLLYATIMFIFCLTFVVQDVIEYNLNFFFFFCNETLLVIHF